MENKDFVSFDDFLMGEESTYEEELEVIENTSKEEKDEEKGKEKTGFRIDNESKLLWALRKYKKAMEKQDEINQFYKAEKKRLDEWKKKEIEKTESQVGFLTFLISEYLAEKKKEDKDYRIVTPIATANFRAQQPDYLYDDEVFIDWARDHAPDCIRIKEEIDKKEVKSTFIIEEHNLKNEQGEIVRGVTVVEKPDTLNIKLED